MITSNINIVSNIYIRSDPNIKTDRKYMEKITGPKLLRAIAERNTSFDPISLSDMQNKIISEYKVCCYAKNGEMSFGPVMKDGVICWVNRCEYTGCRIYEACMSAGDAMKITHCPTVDTDTGERESLDKFLRLLGVDIRQDTVVFERDKNPDITGETEEQATEYAQPEQYSGSQEDISGKGYVQITEPDCIITAPVSSHIILNSGPGTGKTYTIIQRLIYLLENRLCPADEIYILCYTRSAKRVIAEKLEDAVSQGIIPFSARDICILTFDSYAAYFLMEMKEQGIIDKDIAGCSYNERIKLFNKYISSEDLENISYFIVDEIQDLVNERAQMVLNILGKLRCGYFLAGDRCQSIYDYEADRDAVVDSVKFYRLAEELFPEDMQRYEITVNRRQQGGIADEAAEMRRVLLSESISEQNRYAAQVMAEYSEKVRIEDHISTLENIGESTAILCRSNGEAEYVNGLLCERGIPHVLNRGVENALPLPRWIADVFWDYINDTMSKNAFMERFSFRCSLDREPEKMWQALCEITRSRDSSVIDMPGLRSALASANDIPDIFYDTPPLLTVSTIHKAKGSEFDRVILIDSAIKPSSESAEEARVRYVALTRPKRQFTGVKKKRKYFKRTFSGRVIETGFHNYYSKKKKFCKSITAGLTGDIDSRSFVSGDFDSVIDQQEYIINNVKLYDRLTAGRSPESGAYVIFHNGHGIGSFSEKMVHEIEMGIGAVHYKYSLPDSLEKLYVSGITSEVINAADGNVPAEFRKSGICFGIQVTGLAELKFEKR